MLAKKDRGDGYALFGSAALRDVSIPSVTLLSLIVVATLGQV